MTCIKQANKQCFALCCNTACDKSKLVIHLLDEHKWNVCHEQEETYQKDLADQYWKSCSKRKEKIKPDLFEALKLVCLVTRATQLVLPPAVQAFASQED